MPEGPQTTRAMGGMTDAALTTIQKGAVKAENTAALRAAFRRTGNIGHPRSARA